MNDKPTQRLDGAHLLIALGAVVLLIALFLNWFGFGLDGSVSAWTSFEIADLLLAALAAWTLWAIVFPSHFPGDPGLAATRSGLVAFIIVVASLLDPPPVVDNAEIEFGAWLALAASMVMAIGALLTLARVSVSISVSGREPRRSPEPEEAPAAAPTEEPGADFEGETEQGEDPAEPGDDETQVLDRP